MIYIACIIHGKFSPSEWTDIQMIFVYLDDALWSCDLEIDAGKYCLADINS
jgi:hypothetical protein